MLFCLLLILTISSQLNESVLLDTSVLFRYSEFKNVFLQSSTLETVLYLLEDVDLPPTPAKKTSRELSGDTQDVFSIFLKISKAVNRICEN